MSLYVGEGFEREQCHLLSSLPAFNHFLTAHKQIGPLWCGFLGGWACVHSRTLRVSPTNSLVRLGVSPTATIPIGFYSQRFGAFLFLCWNPGLCILSHSPVVPSSLSAHKCGTASSPSCCLATHPLSWLPVSAPPTGLDECFFSNSLVVGLSYSLILWQLWLFFVFKFVVVLLLVV